MSSSAKRILVVDDDEDILTAVRLAFEERGFDVITASDGTEAMIRAERDAPDLIVLDLVMPRRTGLAVLERVRKSPRQKPVIIVVSGTESSGLPSLTESMGADAFMNKPFDIDQMVAKAEALLAERE